MSSGCGCKEVYRFPHITYPYIVLLFIFYVFRSCSSTFLDIFNNFSRSINKHTGDYGPPTEAV